MIRFTDILKTAGFRLLKIERQIRRGTFLKRKPTEVQRFFSQVEKTEHCWNWTGNTVGRGHGAFHKIGKYVLAHRYSYELHVGNIPRGRCVYQTCRNIRCVNPSHLKCGTQAENIALMDSTGRRSSKLTDSDISEIRRLFAGEHLSRTAIAKQFAVHPSTISRVVGGKSWNIKKTESWPDNVKTQAATTASRARIASARKHAGARTTMPSAANFAMPSTPEKLAVGSAASRGK